MAGQALAAISGFIFDSETHQEALKILIERYENTQVLISFYIETLVKNIFIKLESMENLKALRKLFDDMESCIQKQKQKVQFVGV